jgi:hypothetical protein
MAMSKGTEVRKEQQKQYLHKQHREKHNWYLHHQQLNAGQMKESVRIEEINTGSIQLIE